MKEENLDTGAIRHEEFEQPNRIPGFLKVLCILTFVGAGMGILGGIYAMLANDFTIKTMEMSQNNPFAGYMDYTDYIERLRKYGVLAGFVNTLASVMCLTGALMMWKLKKTGFYIYIVGQILPFIALYGLLGGSPSVGPMQGLVVAGQIIGIIIPLTFVILYGLNLKHLK